MTCAVCIDAEAVTHVSKDTFKGHARIVPCCADCAADSLAELSTFDFEGKETGPGGLKGGYGNTSADGNRRRGGVKG